MVKAPALILYNGKKKKCFGIHINDNYIIKMNGTLVQIPKEKIEIYG